MRLEVNDIALSGTEFERVRSCVYELAGISLGDAKRSLVLSRLTRLVRARGLATFSAYLDAIEADPAGVVAQEFVNALTTNLTRFWREEHHFTHLVSYVGELMKTRPVGLSQRLRIWSAGCSTGQEPFTIAFSLLAAYPELKRWDFKVLATDIDTAVLAKAATAVYPAGEVSGLEPAQRRLFEMLPDGRVRVPAAVASVVAFKPLNLMAEWPMKGPFDAIFCRNVTIYFDRPTQEEVFSRFGRMLAPGGYLYIGHSEHMAHGRQDFRLVGKTIYQERAESPVMPRARDTA